KPSGETMQDEDWEQSHARSIMIFYNGDAIPEPGPRGERITDESLLILLNAAAEPATFTPPDGTYGWVWRTAVHPDSTAEDDNGEERPGDTVEPLPHKTVSLVCPREDAA